MNHNTNIKHETMDERATKMYSEAVRLLKDAGDELYRPEEDVVSFLVCNFESRLETMEI